MEFKRIMIGIGIWCAGVPAALIFAPPGSNHSFWTSAAILGSASLAGFAFAFGTVRSAIVPVALYVFTMGGIAFFASHRGEPLGVLALVAVVAANAVGAWARWSSRAV